MKYKFPFLYIGIVVILLFSVRQASFAGHPISRLPYSLIPSSEFSIACTEGDIILSDALSLSILCPADITVQCPGDVPPVDILTVMATSTCGGAITIIHLGDVITNQICPYNYLLTRTYQASDLCGNSATCDQLITVFDNSAPFITCPPNVTLSCTQGTSPVNAGFATSTDNCDPVAVITFNDSYIPGICPSTGDILRTWITTDDCANSSSCLQVITVVDSDPPFITCPPNVTLSCTQNTLPINTGTATSTDNCDPNPAITFADSYTPGICTNTGYIIRTWSTTDDCGNSSTCLQVITVEDTNPPVISNGPADITVSAPGTSPCSAYVPIGIPTVTDDCDQNVAFSNDFNFTNDASDIYPEGSTLVTFTATDDCGNTSSHTLMVTIICAPPPISPMIVYSNGNVDINGYTRLGEASEGAPPIKMKELPLTNTGVSYNSSVTIPHNLTASKILSVSVLVEWDLDLFAPPEYSASLNLRYGYSVTSTDIVLQNNALSGSCDICDKPAKILIIYKE
jgi:hypothetical protein